MCIDRFVWHKSIFRVIEILCFGLGIIRDSLLVICICICEHIQHRMRFSLMIRARFDLTFVMIIVRKYPAVPENTCSCTNPPVVPTRRSSKRRASVTRRLNKPLAPSSTCIPEIGCKLGILIDIKKALRELYPSRS